MLEWDMRTQRQVFELPPQKRSPPPQKRSPPPQKRSPPRPCSTPFILWVLLSHSTPSRTSHFIRSTASSASYLVSGHIRSAVLPIHADCRLLRSHERAQPRTAKVFGRTLFAIQCRVATIKIKQAVVFRDHTRIYFKTPQPRRYITNHCRRRPEKVAATQRRSPPPREGRCRPRKGRRRAAHPLNISRARRLNIPLPGERPRCSWG